VPCETLAWPDRSRRLRAQLAECEADIVMLQEVQAGTFESDFRELLDTCGYAASLQEDDSRRPYANVILYKTDRYKLIAAESRSRVQIAVLRERAERAEGGGVEEVAGRVLYLANVHLQKGGQEEITRLAQLRSLFKRLSNFREVQRKRRGAPGRGRNRAPPAESAEGGCALESCVIGGDFNCARKSDVYRLMRDSGLQRFPASKQRPGGGPAGGGVYRTGFLPLQDVYESKVPLWGPFTASHCTGSLLDYIWASTDLEVVETLPRALERAHAARFPERVRNGAQSGGGDTEPEEGVFLRRERLPLPSEDGLYVSDHLPAGCVLRPRAPRLAQGKAQGAEPDAGPP